jgi:hypothetical protein
MADEVTKDVLNGEAKFKAHAPVIARNSAGQFLPGHAPVHNSGRKVGARAKLASVYCEDLLEAWEKHGKSALEKTATLDPVAFVKAIGQLLPRETQIDIDLTLTRAIDAAEAFTVLSNLPKQQLLEMRANALDAD